MWENSGSMEVSALGVGRIEPSRDPTRIIGRPWMSDSWMSDLAVTLYPTYSTRERIWAAVQHVSEPSPHARRS